MSEGGGVEQDVSEPVCETCKGKRRVIRATIKPEWAFMMDPRELAKETNPLPPAPGSGQSMFEFTEGDYPDCSSEESVKL